MSPIKHHGGTAPTYRLRPGRVVRPRNTARIRALLAIASAVIVSIVSTVGATKGLKVLEGSDRPAAEDWRVQQSPNVQAAQRLLHVIASQQEAAPLARAVVLAEAVTYEQARLGGALVSAPIGLPTHLTPSAAVTALVGSRQLAPSAEQQRAIAALDSLPDPLGPGLTRMINAYLGFENATFDAFAFANFDYLRKAAEASPASAEGLPPPSTGTGTPPLATLRNAGIDVGPPMAARNALLEAALYLQYARLVTSPSARGIAPSTPAAAASAMMTRSAPVATECPTEPTINIAPVVAIDIDGTHDCFSQEYALIIDLDGADTYKGAAGNVLIDVGEDDDQHLARNGGTSGGAGFLVDDGGNDVYIASAGGTNGGAVTGIGFLLDAGDGNDTYTGGSEATNGGALSGAGALVDAGGNDTYSAGDKGTNGGASVSLGLPASGFLVDAGGTDFYQGGSKGTNGGSDSGSLGYLLDAGRGKDSYNAAGGGTNGSGRYGIGFLYDVGGHGDSYIVDARPDDATNGTGGPPAGHTTGAGAGRSSPAPGAGLLLDGGGRNDTYQGGDAGASGTDLSVIPKGPVGAQFDRCSGAPQSVVTDLSSGDCDG